MSNVSTRMKPKRPNAFRLLATMAAAAGFSFTPTAPKIPNLIKTKNMKAGHERIKKAEERRVKRRAKRMAIQKRNGGAL